MATVEKVALTEEENKKIQLKKMFSSAGWKYYQEEVIDNLIFMNRDEFTKLTSMTFNASDVNRLNWLIWEYKFLTDKKAMTESLKDEVR